MSYAEDDHVEIEENYGCQLSALDLYLHVPLARGPFPLYARWSFIRMASRESLLRGLKTLLGTAACYARQIVRLEAAPSA